MDFPNNKLSCSMDYWGSHAWRVSWTKVNGIQIGHCHHLGCLSRDCSGAQKGVLMSFLKFSEDPLKCLRGVILEGMVISCHYDQMELFEAFSEGGQAYINLLSIESIIRKWWWDLKMPTGTEQVESTVWPRLAVHNLEHAHWSGWKGYLIDLIQINSLSQI